MAGTFFLVLLQAVNACSWEGVVVRIIDGDSLKVQRDGKIYELRLYGIDTPEYRQPYSNKAKQYVRRHIYRQVVHVSEKDIDRYGRIVALVTSGNETINRELVLEGLAWFYPRYCREQPLCSELQQLEKKAVKERRGLWRDEKPISPWEWKRRSRKAESESRSPRYR